MSRAILVAGIFLAGATAGALVEHRLAPPVATTHQATATAAATTSSSSTTLRVSPTTCAPVVKMATTRSRRFWRDGKLAAEYVTTATPLDFTPKVVELQTHTETTATRTLATTVDRSTPLPPGKQALPRWSLLYAPQLLPTTSPLGLFDVGVRLAGPLLVEAWALPTAPAAGLGVRVELSRWSLLYAPRVLPTTSPLGLFDVGVRLAGPLSVEAWAVPTAPAAGLGVRVALP